MAATEFNAANVTKFDAGGSGDNVISDGYIKSVEKIRIDSFTLTGTSTHNTIDIAVIDSNKKITSIDVTLLAGASLTTNTIRIGHQGDADAFFSAEISSNETFATISIPYGLFQTVGLGIAPCHGSAVMPHTTHGTTGTITVDLFNWTVTSATIKTIVRYT